MALAAEVMAGFPAAFRFIGFAAFFFFDFYFLAFGFFRFTFCHFDLFAFKEAQQVGLRHGHRGGEAWLRDRGGDQAGGEEEQGYALDSRAHPLENRPFRPAA